MHDYPLLMLDTNTVTRKAIIQFSHSIGVHLHPEIECGSLELMIQLAKNGVGIACVPKEYVRRDSKSKRSRSFPRARWASPSPKGSPFPLRAANFLKCSTKIECFFAYVLHILNSRGALRAPFFLSCF